MDHRILDLIATVMDAGAGPPGQRGRGHPRAETVRVPATLRRFRREAPPWRGLRATPEHAGGSTLRRHLAAWARADNRLQQAHAVRVALLRGHAPDDLILDGCAVRAERGGDLTGPNPTDRGQRGTKYHVAVTGDGLPVARAATAADVNDTVPFERLFLTACAVLARIRTVFADKGYDAEPHRELCRAFGAAPRLHRRGRPHGSGLGRRRWPVERSIAWPLENRRLALRYDRLGFVVQSLLHAACLFLVAGRLARAL